MAKYTTVDGQSSSYSMLADQSHADIGDIPKMDMERLLPRQVSTGTLRGTQTITGGMNIKDVTTNNEVISQSGPDQRMLVSDPNTQLVRIVIGKMPNGDFGIAISKPGYDVLEAFR